MLRSIQFTLFIILFGRTAVAQSGGFGYNCDFGSKSNYNVGTGYNQSLETIRHNFFVRSHSDDYKKSSQFQLGFRTDSLWFQNYSTFLSEDEQSIDQYSTDAYIIRKSVCFGWLKQRQFTKNPQRFVFALNYGFTYEHVTKVSRSSLYDNVNYDIGEEFYKNNLVFMGGCEIRYLIFTMGFKVERNLFETINHDYIIDQIPSLSNSSELRGLRWDPLMSYMYIGIKFDFK
jgi:hypothetical protein